MGTKEHISSHFIKDNKAYKEERHAVTAIGILDKSLRTLGTGLLTAENSFKKYSLERRSIKESLWTFGEEIFAAKNLLEDLQKRTSAIIQGDSVYIQLKDKYHSNTQKRERKLLLSLKNPYENKNELISGMNIHIDSNQYGIYQARIFSREFIVREENSSVVFKYINMPQQDQNVSISRDKNNKARLQSNIGAGYYLTKSPSLKEIQTVLSEDMRKELQESINPEIPISDFSTVTHSLNNYGRDLIKKYLEFQ